MSVKVPDILFCANFVSNANIVNDNTVIKKLNE